MKKILFFILVAIISFQSVSAQQLSKAYLDSAKAFFTDWTANQKDFVYTVMDNTVYPIDIDFALYRIHFESLLYSPATVYKIDEAKTGKRIINDITEKQRYATDSLTLTEDEVDSALAKLHASTSFQWTKDILPNAEIIDTGRFFTRWRNTLNGVPKPAYWTISLPSFFRDGNYCLMFYMYYCGPGCGYEAIIVYKNDNGRWHRFGTFSEREFK